MNTENTTPDPQNDTSDAVKVIPQSLQKGLQGLLYRLRESVVPEIRYLEGETKELVIRMAPYRRKLPIYLMYGGGILFLISLGFYLAASSLEWSSTIKLVTGASALATLYATAKGGEELLLYEQWQFILTDKRIILVTPDPSRRGFADAIYLKQGKIQVLDTNWSRRPLWGLFQATQGSRDVMLSMSGYEFKEEGAQVKGGLRFPDVLPEDVSKLEKLIFG